MLKEINEIPAKALAFMKNAPDYSLPLGVPYLGMGSSWFAPLAFKYMGVGILPETASEYFNYLRPGEIADNAVILSQSGRSSEALWCGELFREYTAITNCPESALGTAQNVSGVVDIMAGDEQYSSSKTYINTLLALFRGFGMDASKALEILVKNMPEYERKGREMADEVFGLVSSRKVSGIYILGSGPNIATALEAALILSESTKICFTGMSMAQYDHGPKETAPGSIVIQILAKGKSYGRAAGLTELIKASGAHVINVEEPEAEENFSILHNIIPFNYMAYYLARKLGITETFVVGGKVTEAKC